jgi:hypothetical protein
MRAICIGEPIHWVVRQPREVNWHWGLLYVSPGKVPREWRFCVFCSCLSAAVPLVPGPCQWPLPSQPIHVAPVRGHYLHNSLRSTKYGMSSRRRLLQSVLDVKAPDKYTFAGNKELLSPHRRHNLECITIIAGQIALWKFSLSALSSHVLKGQADATFFTSFDR